MKGRHSMLYIARVVLEAKTALSVSTGSPDGVFDTALVRDANGLPAIPGTSLAGVLRHLWQDVHGVESAKDLFGYQEGKTGRPSRAAVSWGALLDGGGRPAEALLLGNEQKRLDDPLFRRALDQIDAPVYRNRVRITHRGAAAFTGKFDRAVLPAGNHFAVELRLWAPGDDDGSEWRQLLSLLAHPGFRLGGATRAGLGCMRAVTIRQAGFDLREPDQAAAFRRLEHGLGDTEGLEAFEPVPDAGGWVSGTLRLTARGLWRIGQGDVDLESSAKKPADLLPVAEERVAWNGGQGAPALRALVVPASSIKGALAHRMAFHAHCHARVWAEDAPRGDEEPSLPGAVTALVGEVKDKKRSAEETRGRAGCLFIDDAFLPVDAAQITRLMHNAIDRFTGGVRDRVLYEEQSLYGGEVEVPIAIDVRRLKRYGDVEAVRESFKTALTDLCEGRLGLGSRTTTGNGFFTGEITGNLKQWLDGHDSAHSGETA